MGILDDMSKNTDKEILKLKIRTEEKIAEKNAPNPDQTPQQQLLSGRYLKIQGLALDFLGVDQTHLKFAGIVEVVSNCV